MESILSLFNILTQLFALLQQLNAILAIFGIPALL